MKTYLVTGAGGLICSALIDELLNQQNSDVIVYAAGRSIKDLRYRFGEHEMIKYIAYDATSSFLCDFSVDYVIHGASIASPELFTKKPVETMWTSIFGIHEILEYARKGMCKKIIFISSSEVYGKTQPRKTGYIESDYGFVDVLSPRSSYPMGKRAAETLCASYAMEYNVNVSIVRPGHIYGPTCSPKDRRVSSAFAWQAARGEELVLKSTGTSMRSYTHARDCSRGILTVCEKGASGEAYNIANRNGVCSIRRMAEIMAKAGGVKLRMELPNDDEKYSFNPMDNSCIDSTKLELLGWNAEITPEYGFTQTVIALRKKLKETFHA